MKFIDKISTAILGIMLFSAPAAGYAAVYADEAEITTAWQSEHEAFIPWYAKKMQWDKELGINLKLLHFQSGDEIAKSLQSTDWAVAGIGMKPALTSVHAHKMLLIGIANNESEANAVYVHKDSPIVSVKGQLAEYPGLCGSKELIANKTVLYTKNTSAELLLDVWLDRFDLTKSDLKLKSFDPRAASGAFKAGMGDIFATWSPYTLVSEKNGFVQIANGKTCGIEQYVFLVANSDYASRHPEQIEKVMQLYFRGIERILHADKQEIAKEYIQFYKEWIGQELDMETALRDLELHRIYPLAEQIGMFRQNDANQSTVKNFLLEMIDFYNRQGAVKSDDLPRLQRLDNISDTFLKAVRQLQ